MLALSGPSSTEEETAPKLYFCPLLSYSFYLSLFEWFISANISTSAPPSLRFLKAPCHQIFPSLYLCFIYIIPSFPLSFCLFLFESWGWEVRTCTLVITLPSFCVWEIGTTFQCQRVCVCVLLCWRRMWCFTVTHHSSSSLRSALQSAPQCKEKSDGWLLIRFWFAFKLCIKLMTWLLIKSDVCVTSWAAHVLCLTLFLSGTQID